MPPSPGQRAPEIALPVKPGEAPLRLSDYRGERRVVVLFFPLAFSGTCTEEMRAAADGYDRWTELDAEIVGISVDSPFVNQRFAEECGCPFPVLSDFNREASRDYDVLYEDYHGLEGVSKRAAFVVDREGRIAYAWVSDDASRLPPFEEIREALREAD
ncbi:MAG: redoxin domain-containing protein [Gemmatimonadetes bacterium]|nr:redoxin domain-containing protein [Gemmatimonadota bacterium]